METSAKDTVNITELFDTSIRAFLKKINVYGRENNGLSKKNTLVIDLEQDSLSTKDTCCLK